MMDQSSKPKDDFPVSRLKPYSSLFYNWIPTRKSLGDLGPGYPIDCWVGEHTKLSKLLIKFGVSSLQICNCDTFLRNKRSIVFMILFGATAFIAGAATYIQRVHNIAPLLLTIMLLSLAVFIASAVRIIWD